MVQSQSYQDVDWSHKKNVLEIKSRVSDRHNLTINSKQVCTSFVYAIIVLPEPFDL